MQPLAENKVKKFMEWFNLRSELEDFQTIQGEIEKAVVFKGTNLWILIFAIVVASVGLNMNSTAVIIGAMLISPLMGPINGMGYALATYNFGLFRRAGKNFLFAVGVSLITSTIYFWITPVSEAHSELLARISPTIYDVIIAFFGGLAGTIALSSKLKGNVIPGVAIATALMPPICTAGYGLATLQPNFFFGAFYLFAINTVFIALSTLLVCQYLNFPIKNIVDTEKIKKVNHIISIITIVTLVPSIFFAFKLVQDADFSRNSRLFLRSASLIEGNYLQSSNIDVNRHTVELVYSGYGLSDANIEEIKLRALTYNLDSAKVNIMQGFEANLVTENVQRFQTETEILNNRLNAANYSLMENQRKLDSLSGIPLLGKQLLEEIKPLYPSVKTVSYSETYRFTSEKDSTVQSEKIPLIVLHTQKNLTESDKNKIEEWSKKRLKNNSARVLFETE